MGAILHDIGKIGIPDAVLNKPGKLTSEEYELMKQHAAIGARIVQSVGALQGVVPIVRYHQERYDGSGYPEGLKGEEIPIGARIIGVVDTYGAMTEDRVYRATPGHDKALDELQRLAGKQFDPTVVEAFIRSSKSTPTSLSSEPYVIPLRISQIKKGSQMAAAAAHLAPFLYLYVSAICYSLARYGICGNLVLCPNTLPKTSCISLILCAILRTSLA